MLSTEKRNFKRIFLLFTYPFIFLSKLIPRNKNIWMFGNFKGYIDNTKYIFEYLHNSESNEIEIYWITRDKKLYSFLKLENKNVLYYYSFQGVWKSFRAGVCFMANGYSDLNKIAAINSYLVHLWHGFPIKKIVFDAELETTYSSFGILNRFLTLLSEKSMQFLNDKIDLYLVSSDLELNRMSKAFNVGKHKFRITGTPRLDIIANTSVQESIILEVFGKINTTSGKNIMYAPSWRENGWASGQIINDPKKLTDYLELHNCYLFIKRHPLTSIDEIEKWGIKKGNRINFIDNFDINESYQIVDVLITDFSSLIFDYGILKKPILYFITDLVEYSNNRGFYDDIVQISNDAVNSSWDELLESLENLDERKRYINHPHFDYLLKNPFTNVRKNIVELVKQEVEND